MPRRDQQIAGQNAERSQGSPSPYGKVKAQFALRVISRTPAASRRARMRKPSCLISCSQPGPEGGSLTGDGRHGSMVASPERVRSLNDMGRVIKNQSW
jgi:hypothetical protein